MAASRIGGPKGGPGPSGRGPDAPRPPKAARKDEVEVRKDEAKKKKKDDDEVAKLWDVNAPVDKFDRDVSAARKADDDADDDGRGADSTVPPWQRAVNEMFNQIEQRVPAGQDGGAVSPLRALFEPRAEQADDDDGERADASDRTKAEASERLQSEADALNGADSPDSVKAEASERAELGAPDVIGAVAADAEDAPDLVEASEPDAEDAPDLVEASEPGVEDAPDLVEASEPDAEDAPDLVEGSEPPVVEAADEPVRIDPDDMDLERGSPEPRDNARAEERREARGPDDDGPGREKTETAVRVEVAQVAVQAAISDSQRQVEARRADVEARQERDRFDAEANAERLLVEEETLQPRLAMAQAQRAPQGEIIQLQGELRSLRAERDQYAIVDGQ